LWLVATQEKIHSAGAKAVSERWVKVRVWVVALEEGCCLEARIGEHPVGVARVDGHGKSSSLLGAETQT
jgi:hypothetical protein